MANHIRNCPTFTKLAEETHFNYRRCWYFWVAWNSNQLKSLRNQKAKGTKNTSGWCQTCSFPTVMECGSLCEKVANIDLLVHLKGWLERLPNIALWNSVWNLSLLEFIGNTPLTKYASFHLDYKSKIDILYYVKT